MREQKRAERHSANRQRGPRNIPAIGARRIERPQKATRDPIWWRS